MLRMLLAASALSAIPFLAQAAPQITAGSTLNIVGDATFTSTAINFVNPADITPGTGAYTSLGTCTGCVVMNTPFTYAPFTSGLLAAATNGGVQASIDVTGQILPPAQVGNDLDLTDSVELTLTGFATTKGVLDLTVNEASGIVSGSFSSTVQAEPAPEPSTLALIGAGLLGLGMLRLRWKGDAS